MSPEVLRNAKKAIGAKQATKMVEKGLAAVVLLAADADERVIGQLRDLCVCKAVPVEMVASMAELGRACAIEVGAAAVAVLK
jgi:large subunit ribosomal protein L7A